MAAQFRIYYWFCGRIYKATNSEYVGVTSRLDKQLCFNSQEEAENVAKDFANSRNVETIVVDYESDPVELEAPFKGCRKDRIVSFFKPIKDEDSR